ncbi:MAG: cytochrome ubiquinol oxidase subunit I, partial [Candidatus Calescibacterium sp.]|nr:cytochrome ubiquinol oxidase subunit I [Candidatus Calescibacterium sp.]
DEKNQRNIINIELPYFNSLLYGVEFFPPHVNLNIEMKGIKEFVKTMEDGTVVKEHPPVAITYYTFRIMIFLGTFFAILGIIGLFLLYKNRIDNIKFLKAVLHSWPLPLIANTAGWYTAEIGRQPYIIYGVLKTKDSLTPNLNAFTILLTIVVLLALYLFLSYVAYYLITKTIKNLNQEVEELPASEPIKEV